MAAVIDEERCTGCGACETACPGDVIYMDWGKGVAVVKYPEECWFCCSCRLECPQECIGIQFPMSIVP